MAGTGVLWGVGLWRGAAFAGRLVAATQTLGGASGSYLIVPSSCLLLLISGQGWGLQWLAVKRQRVDFVPFVFVALTLLLELQITLYAVLLPDHYVLVGARLPSRNRLRPHLPFQISNGSCMLVDGMVFCLFFIYPSAKEVLPKTTRSPPVYETPKGLTIPPFVFMVLVFEGDVFELQ